MRTRNAVRGRLSSARVPIYGNDREQLYANVCQACHMPDGKGAVGAGTYLAAKDPNLEAGGYPVYVVVRGQRAMPPVGAMMSDEQVAAVVNYVRTHSATSTATR